MSKPLDDEDGNQQSSLHVQSPLTELDPPEPPRTPSIEEVRRIVSELTPGERKHWDTFLDAVATLDLESLHTLWPSLLLVAESHLSARKQVAILRQRHERQLNRIIAGARELEVAWQHFFRELHSSLSEAEFGLMTKDFDRELLAEEVRACEEQMREVREQLQRAEQEIVILRQRLGD